MTRIVSVWLPAWPIERMQRQEPDIVPTAEPFVLVEKVSHGLRISAANGPALAAGVRIGTALPDARAALPGLLVRPAEALRDARALRRLAGWLGRYGPACNIDGADGAWIDTSGVAHLFGGEEALVGDLACRLRAFSVTARIGLADSIGAAHALARYGPPQPQSGAIAQPGASRAALAALPVAALRLTPEAARLLVRLGLKRIGQLYGLPRSALAARFRENGGAANRRLGETAAATVLLRLDQALGLIAEPRQPLVPPPEAEARLAFPEPLITSDGIIATLDRLTDTLGERLASRGLGAMRFRLALYRTDGTAAEVGIGTSTPCRDAAHICRLMSERLAQIDAGFGIDLAVLEAGGLEHLGALQIGFGGKTAGEGGAVGRAAGPATLIDRLSNRLGPARVLSHTRFASHVPERAEAWLPAMRRSMSPLPVGAGPGLPRPLLLLARPEPIAVIAEVPEGAPQRFVWRRVARRIVRTQGPERIAPEWWRHIGSDGRAPGTRDYYRLEDVSGAGYWVFRDGLYGELTENTDTEMDTDVGSGDCETHRWFLHGLFQ